MINGDFLDRIKVRFKRGSLDSHYRAVFDSPSGRIVLADLVGKAGVMQTHEGWTSEQMQYGTGRRDLCIYILAMLRIQPRDLQQLADKEVFDD